MVDFGKLRTQTKKAAPIEPLEIFRRLPKPPGINDLYTSQAEVLDNWFKRRGGRDIVVKLHTGGGKTLVGLLIAQSTLNETNEPVLYLAPTRQLVNQTLEKAKSFGIPAVGYQTQASLDDSFINGKAIMVATYKALFNGRSKFGMRGGPGTPTRVGAVILDDAHVAFSVVRDSFTLEVSSAPDSRQLYENLTGLFRKSFRDIDRLGTFDDTVSGMNFGVIEVPYWAWHEKLDAVRETLRTEAEAYGFQWPLLRDNLHLCHALISRKAFTVTPVLPLVSAFPTFADAPRRVYMSATIADDSEIVRTFDADQSIVDTPLSSRSLAGISERMILIPDLMPFKKESTLELIKKLLEWAATKKKLGAVVLVPSNSAAQRWSGVAALAEGSQAAEAQIQALQNGTSCGPAVFASRYDGIDLPGNSCRLLVMDGLPTGTSDYELLRAASLYGGATISRMLAQRIEQGIGRGARGSGDHCVVVLSGSDLAGWIAKDANFRLLTSATRAQLDMGTTVSKEIKTLQELGQTINKSFDRDSEWVEYHAETLAEAVQPEAADPNRFDVATAERKAFNLWSDGYPDKAIARLDKSLSGAKALDAQTKGWLLQFAARIADHWGQKERSEELQRDAYANNRNVLRPRVLPPYRPLVVSGSQAQAIAQQLSGYRIRRGLLQRFEEAAAQLHENATANHFEQALTDIAQMIGLAAERFDVHGQGPDVLWLLPQKQGLIIEAKSRKKEKNALTKEQHGQLLVAQEWFRKNYPDHSYIRVCVHPTNRATKAAAATGSYALTYAKLTSLLADARALLTKLCESQLSNNDLMAECSRELDRSPLRADKLVSTYLEPFVDE